MKTWEEYLAYAKNCTDLHGHDEELWIGKDQYNSILTNARADLLKENAELKQQLSEAREQVKVMREALRLWMNAFNSSHIYHDKVPCETDCLDQAIRATEKLIE